MKKIILYILIIPSFSSLLAQDKGKFENYSNLFYKKILNDSKAYEQNDLEKKKSFKMDFEGKKIPKSIDEFKIIKTNEPISQGNTGTCWCFSTISFFESEIYRLTEKSINISELYPVYFEYIEKTKGYISSRGNSHLGEGSETNAAS